MAVPAADRHATVWSTVLGLSNNIVGAGILTLPSCFKDASIVEGTLLMVGVGALSGLSLVLIAVCCEITQCFSFRGMGEKTLGPGFGVAIQAIMLVYTFFSCVSFMILAGDFFTGPNGIPHSLCGGSCSDSWFMRLFDARATSVLVLTLVVLCPLSCLRDLNALRFTSMLSMFGMVYLLGLLVYAYADATPEQLPAKGEIAVATPSLGVFSAAPVINVAFIAHYNVPRFYEEMRERTIANFSRAVAISLGVCGSVYILVGLFGYLRFGAKTEHDVLNNFKRGTDMEKLATMGRIAMSGVVLFTYPLAFNSHRASAITLLNKYVPSINAGSPRVYYGITLGLVSLTFLLGATLTDIGVVLDYKGAILGGCIGFAFPGWMFLAAAVPNSVQWCCVKPSRSAQSPASERLLTNGDAAQSESAGVDAEVEAGVALSSLAADDAHVPSSAASPRAIRYWHKTSFLFMVYAVVSGVMGVVITTRNLIEKK